jgi:nucleoside-diphosphate-sugar epimerase
MRAIVTGGAGFIGRWVVKRLLEAKHEVIVLDDLSNGRRENLAEFEGWGGWMGLVEGDLKDRNLLAKLFAETTWDRVYHLGASIHVQRSIDEPEITFRNDVDGTFALLEACRAQYFRLNGMNVEGKHFHLEEVKEHLRDFRPRLVVMSTCMVYSRANDENGISEDHPLCPASPYAASKIAADNLALSYFHSYRMPVTVVRPFNTYGPFQKSNLEGGVVSIFLKRDIQREPLQVKGDGTQTRDLLFVEDCADFVVRAGESPEAEGEVINAGTGCDIQIRELATMVATGGNKVEFILHDHPQAEISKLLCNPSKAKKQLGWIPSTSLEEGLAKTRKWLISNRWAW